jgi:thiol-disulfide isomerase/thioredoxin
MKNLSFLFLFFAITNSIFSQNKLNNIVFDENANQEILLGYCDIVGLKNSSATDWFVPEYENYIIDEEALKSISPETIQELEIFMVLGTWCSDSQREVPRIYKILEYLEYNFEHSTIIAVNRNKDAEDTVVKRLNIELVPTFIFYRDGAEIGRIIETPSESLEKDLFKIISIE